MFTGIIESVGIVRALRGTPEAMRLIVEAPFGAELAVGESVAVDGCCVTALATDSGALEVDLSPETLACTTLGSFMPGRRVNLERALRADARLSGHVVQGHVDGLTTLVATRDEGAGLRQRWSLGADQLSFVAPKGSVSVDGVSLTVAALGPDWFEVALIPHSLAVTTLRDRVVGDHANLELDIAAKLAVRASELGLGGGPSAPWGRAWLERHSSGAPWEPLVGYCRAIRTGHVIRVSGCAPVASGGGTHAPGDAGAQAQRCFEIAQQAVRSLGGPDAVIVRTRMFVTDITQWEAFGRAHARAFGAEPPATTMVEVSGLIAEDMLIEIEADAEIPPGARAPEPSSVDSR